MHTNQFWSLRKPLSILLVIGLLLTGGAAGAQEPASDTTGAGAGPAVIGGSNANPKDYPYYVMLTDRSGEFFCGGTLIRDRWVLTAAHCTFGTPDKGITVRFGVKSDTDYVDAVRSDKVITHPDFDWGPQDPDVALIRLERKPKMASPLIAKTKFVTGRKLPKIGSTQKIIGYGITEPNGGIGDLATKLQQGDVKIKRCSGATESNKANICAGGAKVTSCNGDSGGPLLVNNKVAGIVSRGTGPGCVDQTYGVYTRVSTHKAWINQQMKQNRPGRASEPS